MTPVLLALILSQSIVAQQNEEKKQPAAAEPSESTKAFMTAQAPLLAAASRIQKLEREGGGLGGIRLQVDQHTLEVWWKGGAPASVRKEIEQLQHDSGVKIVLGSSAYSHRELRTMAHDIASKHDEYPGLVSVGPAVDGSGLEIGHTDLARASSLKFPVPVHIVQRENYKPLARADYVPPGAGAATRAAATDAGLCTTGFAMGRFFLWFRTSSGVLTAEHCHCGGNVVFNTGTGVPIGTAEPASNRSLNTDSLYITTGNFGTLVYDGGVGVGEFTKTVVGTQSNFPGLGVCTSGAGTGVHCGIFIDLINQAFIPVPNACPATLPFVESVSIAHQTNGGVATGFGDSGGPAFTLTGADNSMDKAAGMMFGALQNTVVPCGPFGTVCFSTVLFHDIDGLQSSHGASVLTGAPTGGGGFSSISVTVFLGATLIWGIIRLRRRQSGSETPRT